jgi:hypothetical protein
MSGAASVSAMLASGHEQALHPAISVHKDSAGNRLSLVSTLGEADVSCNSYHQPAGCGKLDTRRPPRTAHRGQID